MAVGPAEKGHSPFPSSERATYGFALYLGSSAFLGEATGAPSCLEANVLQHADQQLMAESQAVFRVEVPVASQRCMANGSKLLCSI